MMLPISDLKKLTSHLKDTYRLEACAVVSKEGLPLAWEMPKAVDVETFSTLVATILGAADVVCEGLQKPSPDRIIIESNNHSMIVKSLGRGALFVGVLSDHVLDSRNVLLDIEESAKKLSEVLEK